MRVRYTLLPVLLLIATVSYCGEGDYAVGKISPALLKNSNVVKRFEKITFEVINTGEAILKKKYALTILNENGDNLAGFVEYYDKLYEIRNIEGSLYDASGKELKRLKNKSIIDVSGMDDNNLADDNRRKYHHFYHRVYPYTVEYEVEIKYNGTLFFPLWLPREEENFAVEQSSITMISPNDYTIRYKKFNYPGEPVLTTDKNRKMLTWSVQQLPSIQREYAGPDWFELNPAVRFGPTAFEIEKYKGNMTDWKEFGKFVYVLKDGRDKLPDAVRKKVHELTDGITDQRQKITVLYNYMQQNTRYISVQLGIGGWQPFDATYVATKAYGDCKALTNYMYSLLKEIGIKSIYTLVRAGENAPDLVTDFPSSQFNHVILSVPFQKDTIWLECTSQTAPAGYLGMFTGNRHALMIDQDGGHLIRTPSYGLKENIQLRKITATVSPTGTLDLTVNTNYAGLQQDNLHGLINALSKDKVKEVLHEQLDFATYDISDFSYQEIKSAVPTIQEKLSISVSNYATITGKRLFIIPNIMTRNGRKLTATERTSDIIMRMAYQDIDTVELLLPEGYTPESMPADVNISNKFGKYQATIKLSGNKLTYYRRIERYEGRFPAKDYEELAGFYQAIYKADRNKVVLVKQEGTN